MNAEIKERIFIQPPSHLSKPGKVWLLKRALYGLKQAGREWYFLYKSILVEFGFKPSSYDPCLFFMREGGKLAVIGVHVDDSLLVFQDQNLCTRFLKFLEKKIKFKDLGPVKSALGIAFRVGRDGVTLCQSKYTQSILTELGFDRCNPAPTPASTEDPLATSSQRH